MMNDATLEVYTLMTRSGRRIRELMSLTEETFYEEVRRLCEHAELNCEEVDYEILRRIFTPEGHDETH